MSTTIKNLDKCEQPREKLLNHSELMSDTEVLAVLIGSGGKNISAIELARTLLKKYGGLESLVGKTIEELKSNKHIKYAKASVIKAAGELTKRVNHPKARGNIIKSPEDAVNQLKHLVREKQNEHLYCISLDSRNRAISIDLISIGTATETLLHAREIFRKAISVNAVSIILAHNHPSGDESPSLQDIQGTQRMSEAGNKVGIKLLDHIIIGNIGYTSLRSQGVLYYPKGGDNNDK